MRAITMEFATVSSLVLLFYLCFPMFVYSDIYEFNPADQAIVVNAGWGEAEDEFSWPGNNWGIGEETRFGPFAVDENESVYLVDLFRNEIKIFSDEGIFVRAISMQQKPNIVDDIAVYNGTVYWFGEAIWGIRLFALEIDTGQLARMEILDDAILTHDDAGRRLTGNCRLVVDQFGLLLYARMQSTAFPVVRSGKAILPSDQSRSRIRGLRLMDGLRIALIDGDIVRISAKGSIDQVLVSNTGDLIGAADGLFLHSYCLGAGKEWRCFYVLRDQRGDIISKTRTPARDHNRTIAIDNRVRLARRGVFYGLYVDDTGVRVVRFQTQ